ncbi:MAG: hypothetical protein ACI9SP_000323 [Arenicella sp.]|jgi:hypothetical protein
MTETQIEQLKKVLADSSLPDNSTELDDAILKSAHEAAQQRVGSGRKANRLLALLPLAFLRTASLAIVFTVGVFLAMGQLVSVNKNTLELNNTAVRNGTATDNPSATMNTTVSEQTIITSSQDSPLNTANVALKPMPSGLSRDQILLNFELNDTAELLATLSFEFSQSGLDRNRAELAIVDINSLIQVGELDNARKRYGEFITRCVACRLPRTLEDLVLAAHNLAIKNSNFETG